MKAKNCLSLLTAHQLWFCYMLIQLQQLNPFVFGSKNDRFSLSKKKTLDGMGRPPLTFILRGCKSQTRVSIDSPYLVAIRNVQRVHKQGEVCLEGVGTN